LLQPLFEYSGACSGCGETPYLKLLTQLFGDRLLIANATGCSSIYGGNLPTTPYTEREGRGPAWANSLFEDNAEFGLGMRLALDQPAALRPRAGREPRAAARRRAGRRAADRADQGGRRGRHRRAARAGRRAAAKLLAEPGDGRGASACWPRRHLVASSVWIVGGDGWAYDIGFGGLDHVLASGRNVNILVLDTEVYSNTGGQASKSTPRGAVAKFAAGGKAIAQEGPRADRHAYGNVYVAQIAMGANDAQTVKAFLEAEAYDGPSLIIAYSHCIAHGIDMADSAARGSGPTRCSR
jgi:pyruvate-ferredoxin/flavodoxin oxidoreductase